MKGTFLNVGVVALFVVAVFAVGYIGAALFSYMQGRWGWPLRLLDRMFSGLDRMEEAGKRRRERKTADAGNE